VSLQSGRRGRMIWRYLQGTQKSVLLRAAILIAATALIDWRIDLNISFGFLYLLPMLLVGSVSSRSQVIGTALFCTILSDLFDPFPFNVRAALPEDILVFSALTGTGLFAWQLSKNRRQQADHLSRIEAEICARRAAEEQLEFLIESSPAAIVTMTPDGKILLANAAAHHLFGVTPGALPGRTISQYIPALGRVPSAQNAAHQFRTDMQCRGHKDNDDVFLANVFFSTYQTRNGPRLAALIVDASEELREREESSLQQLLAGARILAAAVSHEVRNVCGAISIVYENLARGSAFHGGKDFEALGSLVQTLNKVASLDLRQSTSTLDIGGVDLREVLGDLRIVLEPICQEAGILIGWDIPETVPRVWADRHSLMQVLLNLTKNSERALKNARVKEIQIAVSVNSGVEVRVSDTGPGIASTEHLFQPFQKGAEATGLGLYLSRAFMRFFGGELRHEARERGCCFVIELATAIPRTESYQPAGEYAANTTITAG
jgi:two-component system, LuxR family, sensor kinase FixL